MNQCACVCVGVTQRSTVRRTKWTRSGYESNINTRKATLRVLTTIAVVAVTPAGRNGQLGHGRRRSERVRTFRLGLMVVVMVLLLLLLLELVANGRHLGRSGRRRRSRLLIDAIGTTTLAVSLFFSWLCVRLCWSVFEVTIVSGSHGRGTTQFKIVGGLLQVVVLVV